MPFSFKKRAQPPGKEVRAERVPPKGKVFKASKGAKFVLFLGDEGAILVYLKDNEVISRQYVPDASDPNVEEFRETLSKDTKAPMMLVVDSMDQSYVQQTLPPVSSMSVGKLIKRRLDRDFTASDIKGALLLGREKKGRKDWNFMMIALERNPQLTLWLDFVLELPNRFQGIHLVSVEAEIIVKTLEQAMGVPKEGTGSEWKFFVSHNKVGGFRQVILHHGRIIFTRLAQPLADANTEVIAGNIEQEMLSTIEYMKRLSFNPQSGLDIYILASSGIKEAIDPRKFNATTTQIFTPFEMSQLFHIEGGTQPTDQFGDVVLAAIIGCSRKHVLPLFAPQFKRLDTIYQVTFYQRMMAAAIMLGALAYSGYTGFDIMMLRSELSELERKKTTEQNTLTALRNEIARTDLDVERATDLIDLYKQLLQESNSPVPFIEAIRPIIVSPISLKGLEWSYVDARSMVQDMLSDPSRPKTPADGVAAPPNGMQMKAVLTFEFPAVANDAKARRAIEKKLVNDFKVVFANYDVVFDTKAVTVAQDTGAFEKDYSAAKREAAPAVVKLDNDKPVESKMTIRGPYPLVLAKAHAAEAAATAVVPADPAPSPVPQNGAAP